MTKIPKISVCTITYGHEKYISQCIDGVLMQEGNFELEFIISSDNSPDNTKQIIEDYINNHPKGSCIKFIDRKENVGIMPNFYETINTSTGDYVAICDGDDFWTDKSKLQKQLNFLEKNQKYILVGHNVEIFDNETLDVLDSSFPFKKIETISENFIYQKNYIPALSIMFRNVHKLPSWILDCSIGDYPLILYYSQFGKIGFMNDVMASYRKNTGYHSTVAKVKQIEMQEFSLKVVLAKSELSKQQKELLNYQLLQMNINDSSFFNSIEKTFNANINYKLKLKLILNKLL